MENLETPKISSEKEDMERPLEEKKRLFLEALREVLRGGAKGLLLAGLVVGGLEMGLTTKKNISENVSSHISNSRIEEFDAIEENKKKLLKLFLEVDLEELWASKERREVSPRPVITDLNTNEGVISKITIEKILDETYPKNWVNGEIKALSQSSS